MTKHVGYSTVILYRVSRTLSEFPRRDCIATYAVSQLRPSENKHDMTSNTKIIKSQKISRWLVPLLLPWYIHPLFSLNGDLFIRQLPRQHIVACHFKSCYQSHQQIFIWLVYCTHHYSIYYITPISYLLDQIPAVYRRFVLLGRPNRHHRLSPTLHWCRLQRDPRTLPAHPPDEPLPSDIQNSSW